MTKPPPLPEGMSTLSPHLVCDGAAVAIEFYKKAFDAVEITRLPGANGKLMHASVRINGASVMLVDEAPAHGMLGPKALKGTPVSMHLIVADVDKSFAKAVHAGATAVMPPADMFWGDRFGVSWQIVPTILPKYLNDPNRDRAARTMAAMMQMKKLDIAKLEAAHRGE